VSALVNIETARIKTVLEEGRRRAQRRLAVVALAAAAILAAFVYADALDPQRYRDALPTIWPRMQCRRISLAGGTGGGLSLTPCP